MKTRQIHKRACKHCPAKLQTERGVEDPISKDIKDNCTKEHIVKDYLYGCYLRKEKICKGLADYLEIDQETIDNISKKYNNGRE